MQEKLVKTKEIYLTASYLQSLYCNFAVPRNKVMSLLKKGELIHIRRGLYLHGGAYERQFSKAVLSGVICGPSAISFEYALSHYGLIPERVDVVTCLCLKRDKSFKTSVGTFTYKYISRKIYSIGLDYCETVLGNYFIASVEKALCNMAYFEKFESIEDAHTYLFESLRINRSDLKILDLKKLLLLERAYKRKSVKFLVDAVKDEI